MMLLSDREMSIRQKPSPFGQGLLNPHYARTTCCDRGSGRPSLRAIGSTSRKPGVLGSRTLRRTDTYASGPSPCGCPVARSSPRSRCGVSCIMRVKPKRRRRGGCAVPYSPGTAIPPMSGHPLCLGVSSVAPLKRGKRVVNPITGDRINSRLRVISVRYS
jgi:hypothetical protein